MYANMMVQQKGQAGGMAWSKPDCLRLILRTHMERKENGLLQADLWLAPQAQVTSIMISHKIRKIIFQEFNMHCCVM